MRRNVQRPSFGGEETLRDKKARETKSHRADGVPNGLVEVPGPLAPEVETEIRNLARNIEERAKAKGGKILSVTPFQGGIAIETEDEKLAQHIADAIEKSRKATVTRVYDDEGRRRILTCRLPVP